MHAGGTYQARILQPGDKVATWLGEPRATGGQAACDLPDLDWSWGSLDDDLFEAEEARRNKHGYLRILQKAVARGYLATAP